jgi:hypothetical protein
MRYGPNLLITEYECNVVSRQNFFRIPIKSVEFKIVIIIIIIITIWHYNPSWVFALSASLSKLFCPWLFPSWFLFSAFLSLP